MRLSTPYALASFAAGRNGDPPANDDPIVWVGMKVQVGMEAFQQWHGEYLAVPWEVTIETAAIQAALQWFWALESKGIHA